jgi:hypothetical protein
MRLKRAEILPAARAVIRAAADRMKADAAARWSSDRLWSTVLRCKPARKMMVGKVEIHPAAEAAIREEIHLAAGAVTRAAEDLNVGADPDAAVRWSSALS